MSMTDPLELLKPPLKNKFNKTYLDSKHVLKVYIKPIKKKSGFWIFTKSNFACLCEKCPLKK